MSEVPLYLKPLAPRDWLAPFQAFKALAMHIKSNQSPATPDRFHIETLVIYTLTSRKITTQNDPH